MGSWSQTCMISNLPIEEEDPVKVIFLGAQRQDDEWCLRPSEPTAEYKGILLPISGKYADYGQAEFAPGLALDLHMKHFPGGLFNRYHEQNSDVIEIEFLGHSRRVAFTWAMVHQRFYDLVVGWGKYEPREIDEEDRKFFESRSGDERKRLEAIHEFKYGMGLFGFTWMERDIITGLVENPALKAEVIEWGRFIYGLYGIRRALNPMCGWGAQSLLYDRHQAIAEMAAQMCVDRFDPDCRW